MRNSLLIIVLFSFLEAFSQSSKKSTEQYILTYKDYAIAEMYRSGVPASITLAQGILESENGNSRLAREANNHFGIKCKKEWTGLTIIADDDTLGECFRAYGSALESYRDHSDFLKNNWRYSDCFALDKTDYKGWADGLKKAGYATNPKYPILLTSLIERYKLHEYDLAPAPEGFIPETATTKNNVPVVYAKAGESVEIIAEKNNVDARQIYRYNEIPSGTKINPGDIVYLKPKRRKGSEPFHVMKEGETLYDLSQEYGIKLKQLYKINHLTRGQEVAPGTLIYLQKKGDKKVNGDVVKTAPKDTTETVKPAPKPVVKAAPKPVIDPNAEFHIVAAGDNLYKIASAYNVAMEDLLDWNGIVSQDGIKAGDKIYLNKTAAAKAGKNKVSAPPATPKKETTSNSHVVVKGETGYRICKKYDITADQLMKWNKLKDLDHLTEGQKLIVGQ